MLTPLVELIPYVSYFEKRSVETYIPPIQSYFIAAQFMILYVFKMISKEELVMNYSVVTCYGKAMRP